MAESKNLAKRSFPLKTVGDVIELFKSQLKNERVPNLALLSIVIGLIEGSLTNGDVSNGDDDIKCISQATQKSIPIIHWNHVDALYQSFKTKIKGSIDLSTYPKKTSRELVNKISEVIWSHLTRSYYKDRAHLQTLYSYLTANKLDCYGVAYAVVAAAQVLGVEDIKLVLSEDHAWVIFGDNETCEVTWHGKGNEDKRGQSVLPSNSWLYLNGHPVVCNKYMTVASLVSAINPSINANQDSEQLAIIQQQLLWVLYDFGHLSFYPMAMGNLGDLEEIAPSLSSRKSPIELFYEAVNIAKTVYADSHVYPYTYLAGYLYRNGRFKEALLQWAEAANVIKKYNYTRDDEEIYKEFLEIANELIPHMVKVVSAGGIEPSGMSNVPLLQDPECFAALLKFYDGLCGWEEGSTTPVLHIGWAKPLVATIAKFPAFIRAKVEIEADEEDDVEDEEEGENKEKKPKEKDSKESQNTQASEDGTNKAEMNSDYINSLVKDFDANESGVNPSIAELAAKCSESILNPGFLLGTDQSHAFASNETVATTELKSIIPESSEETKENRANHLLPMQESNDISISKTSEPKTLVRLTSAKMAGLKHLLSADKLNTSAIQLQLTAQSQVQTKRGRSSFGAFHTGLTGPELDFVATTTTTLTRTSKRIRRD